MKWATMQVMYSIINFVNIDNKNVIAIELWWVILNRFLCFYVSFRFQWNSLTSMFKSYCTYIVRMTTTVRGRDRDLCWVICKNMGMRIFECTTTKKHRWNTDETPKWANKQKHKYAGDRMIVLKETKEKKNHMVQAINNCLYATLVFIFSLSFSHLFIIFFPQKLRTQVKTHLEYLVSSQIK